MRFLTLSPDAASYYDGLELHRLNARHHVRKVLALAEVYPADAVARAISAEYITNILETRARALPEPGPPATHPPPRSARHRYRAAGPQCLRGNRS
jgi:hypothetical protein